MTLAGVREGDIILADHNGERFYATVDAVGQGEGIGQHVRKGELLVHPIGNGHAPVRIVKAREVADHWRRRRTTKARN